MVRTHGILLAAGSGTRLWPITSYVNKHLCPVYDKPLIYYPLTNLILAGCTSLSIIVNQSDFDAYTELTRYLRGLNLDANLVVQPESLKGIPSAISCGLEDAAGADNYLVMLGDNILVSRGFVTKSLRSDIDPMKMRIFTHPVENPQRFGVVQRDSSGNVSKVIEKPTVPCSKEAIIGSYIIPADVVDLIGRLEPSPRGETEIIDIINHYLNLDRLDVEQLTQGTVWLDAGTTEDLEASSTIVSMMQRTSGQLLGSIEQAALKRGLISTEKLLLLLDPRGDSEYRRRLETIVRTTSDPS